MTRKEARDCGFKIIFEYEFHKTDADDLLALFYELHPDETAQTDYLNELVKAVLSHLDEIDAIISSKSKGWAIGRLSKVTLAVLRTAIGEMLYIEEVPANIAINEAVDLAKLYEDEKAGRFVNGVLASVITELAEGRETQ